jgi:hypothetical protein
MMVVVRRLAAPVIALWCGCNDPRLLANGSPDAMSPDGTTPDGTTPDGPAPDAPMGNGIARMIAPLSTSTVTQQQPTLRWTGSPTAPVVDLCLDRACTQPLAIAVAIAADHNSGKPSAPLPPGWIFWRVHSGTQTTPTWQFFVGKVNASTAVDSSNGTTFDVNGDGYADLLIGGGLAYVYLGNPLGVEMQRIDLTSRSGSGAFGTMVTNLGDVNGDGYADFWVAPSGGMYLGGPNVDASSWNGASAPNRIDSFSSGSPVPLGDVNGDGYADLYFTGTWQTQVWFGGATPDPANTLTLTRPSIDATGGTNGLVWGYGAGGAGDVNGDGYADFVVGAYPDTDSIGTAFVHLYLGSPSPSAADWNAGTNRIDLPGEDPTAAFAGYFGYCISPAGDMNGDGYADFAVGAFYASSSSVAYTGKVHLYLGSPTPATADWVGAAATQRVDLIGPGYFFQIGYAMTPAGDVNNDGYADLVVGGLYDLTIDQYGTGELYLGSPTPGDAIWNAPSTSNRVDLATVDGVNGHFGYTVAGGGDTDGDGYADFVLGAKGGTAGGVAHFYRGEAAPDGTHYNGATPTLRIDMTNPTNLGGFGTLH